MSDRHALFISLRLRFASAILDGDKIFELRRTRPRVEPGTVALLYATTPVAALVGTAEIVEVVSGRPSSLWNEIGSRTCVSRAEFRRYFKGAYMGFALRLRGARTLRKAVSLEDLRARIPGFRPPQAFRYLTTGQLRVLVPASHARTKVDAGNRKKHASASRRGSRCERF